MELARSPARLGQVPQPFRAWRYRRCLFSARGAHDAPASYTRLCLNRLHRTARQAATPLRQGPVCPKIAAATQEGRSASTGQAQHCLPQVRSTQHASRSLLLPSAPAPVLSEKLLRRPPSTTGKHAIIACSTGPLDRELPVRSARPQSARQKLAGGLCPLVLLLSCPPWLVLLKHTDRAFRRPCLACVVPPGVVWSLRSGVGRAALQSSGDERKMAYCACAGAWD